MPEQRNLVIAIILMMVVVFGWQYLVGVPRLQQEQQRQAENAQKAPAEGISAPAGAPAGARGLPRAEAVAQSSQRTAIETPTLGGSINLTGGRFDDLKLLGPKFHETLDPNSPQIELLSPAGAEHPYLAEFGWMAAPGEMQQVPGAQAVWHQTQGDKLAP